MKQRLQQLQHESRALEMQGDKFKNMHKYAEVYANRFLSALPRQKAYRPFDEAVNTLLNEPVPEQAREVEQVFRDIENRIVPPGVNVSSGAHFGYIPGGGIPASATGDYIAAITNRYAGYYSSSPGAALLETNMINWLCSLVGFSDGSGGYLASGGSMANLTAVVTARDSAGLNSAQYSKAVVYLTDQTHHCVEKALNIAGMRSCVRKFIPMNNRYGMKTDKLVNQIEADKKNGLYPWMVVASAGSTDCGAVDPIAELAVVAKKYRLWFHVDAAYGGFFLLTETGRRLFRGISEADSVVLDPHKGLFLPYGIGALVVKDVEKLMASHSYQANYMKHAKQEGDIYSAADISPELSKHFRALRMWLPLQLHGVQAFRSALEEKLLLARYLWKQLNEMDEIETGSEPELSIITFRWKPVSGNPDALNRKLHQEVLKDGRIYLSTTEIEESFYFRIAVLSVRTHLEEADLLLNVLRELIDKLSR